MMFCSWQRGFAQPRMPPTLLADNLPKARKVEVAELLSPTYAPLPVLQWDDEGKVLWANEAARDLALAHGLADLTDLLPRREDAQRVATRSQVGDRLYRWALVTEPKSSAVYAYDVDVIDLAQCERQLRRTQKMELLSELSTLVAHDCNNFLGGITGQLQLALDRETSPEERQDFVQQAVHACGHAARMVRMLLDFAGIRELRPAEANVDGAIAAALPSLGHLVGKRVALEHRPASEPLTIQADPVALERILANPAANARDAMPEGGSFIISVRPGQLAPGELLPNIAGDAGPFVEIVAADTGCGMDAATTARVFEPFFTTKRPGRGTGLGLACVRDLMDIFRGWIEVESAPGAGSRFRLYFPAVERVAV